jgi:phage gpG-like protein
MLKIKIEDIGNSRQEIINNLQQIQKDFPKIALKITKRFLESIRGSIVKNYLKGQVLKSVTGKLSSSINWWLSGFNGMIGSNLEYAAIQEFGGTIVPKNAKYLTIPLWKGAARQIGGAREVPNAFFKMTNGRLLMYGKSKYGIMPYFLLLKSVTLPPRPYIWPAIERFFADDAQRIAETTLSEEIAKQHNLNVERA